MYDDQERIRMEAAVLSRNCQCKDKEDNGNLNYRLSQSQHSNPGPPE